MELERNLEQLRALENQMSIHVGYIKSSPLSVDTQEDLIKVEKLMKWRFGETMPVIKTNYETAELIKYMNNTFFASKVSLMNEFYKFANIEH